MSRKTTGIEYVTLALIEAIQKQKHKVVCFHSKSETGTHPEGVEHHLYRKPIRLPFYQTVASLFRHRCFDGVDLIHFTVPKILYLRKPKVPFILTIHDLIPLRFPHFSPKKHLLMLKYFLPKFLRDARAVIAISHQTKEDLLHYFSIPEEKVHVIYNSLLPRKREISLEKEKFLLYVGSFEPRKNLKGIIEAFALLRSWGYDYKLILAGHEDKINSPPWDLIHKLQLENWVIYKGYISEEEKGDLFQKAAALVWPSFYEGFGLPLLEAMHSGTPIVTSKGSATEEVVGDAAFCVDPKNPTEIGAALAKILSSKETSHDLIKKGLKRAEDFTFDRMVNSLKGLYETIIS